MYLYILKSYYHLKVLYHAIPPFAMDLRQKGIEISHCTSLIIRDYLQRQSQAGEFAACLFNWYCNADGEMVLMKLPWMKFYFLNLSRVGEAKQHNQLAVSKFSMVYTYLENEIWKVVCKSLRLHGDAVDISNGANLWSWERPVLHARGQTRQEIRHLRHQGQVSASYPSSISDHEVHKTCSGLYLPPVPTKTWCLPSPSSFVAD